jgi:5-methylcytosine-specific restriction endonuclease McrA
MAHWPYNTPAWVRLRKVKLQQQSLCEVCMRRGRLVRANTVDHVLSINAGGHPFPTLDELMSMCTPCHNSKSRNIDQPTGKGVAFKGADVAVVESVKDGVATLRNKRTGIRWQIPATAVKVH